jgi:putative FmdB family regulatory protein
VPTYQYACTSCDHAFEQVQSFTDDALITCPRCEGRLRKIFNAVGVVFKGSGFYRTDSRSDQKAAATAASSGPSADSSANTSSDSSGGSNDTKTKPTAAATPAKSEAGATPAKSEAGAA